jgi:signal peptidase I
MSSSVMSSDSQSPDSTSGSSNRSVILYTCIALGIALFIRFFVAAPFIVSGTSMEPNFHDWNYLIVDRVSYTFSEPQRGDVVVLDLPQETSRALIKRIIGLPGDTIILDGTTVTIVNAAHPNGFQLSEPYLDPANVGGATNLRVTLGTNEFFVLGDNRRVSADSRLWGNLPRKDIVGRVILRLWPLSAIGILPEEARYSDTATASSTSL